MEKKFPQIGRSLFAAVAVTFVVLGTFAQEAKAQAIKWTYEVPRSVADSQQSPGQFCEDGAGGVVVIYDDARPTGTVRKFLWLNDQGKVLMNLAVGPEAKIGAVFKQVAYLVGDYKPVTFEAAVRVINRNGSQLLASGAGELGDLELGGFFGGVPTTSRPFTADGFFASEFFLRQNDPVETIGRLRIVSYLNRR